MNGPLTPVLALTIAVAALTPAAAAPSPGRDQIARWTADLDAAETWARAGDVARAGETYARVLAELPTNGGPALLRARGLDGVGDTYRLRGESAAAVDPYRQAAALWEELLGPRQPRLAVTLHNLGAVLLATDRPGEARSVLEHALTIWCDSAITRDEAENTRRLLARIGSGPATVTR